MDLSPKPSRRRGSSFGLLKFISWGTLVLILLSSLFLSIFLANQARQVLLDKQQDFAHLLANTLNSTISKRFYIPVYWIFGKVDLSNAEQFKRLDEVIKSVVEDSQVRDVRIYDVGGVVVYAQDKALLGEKGLGGEAVAQALGDEKFNFEFVYKTGALGTFFSAEIEPGSVVMRTVGPLRIKGVLPMPRSAGGQGGSPAEPGAQAQQPGPGDSPGAPQAAPGAQTPPETGEGDFIEVEGVIGGLEFTLDITGDYQKLITFQRIIILSNLVSALVIFFILRKLIHRADRLNAQRLQEREEFEREMLQNEKLASMGRMVAGIAHEIRNPLGIIRSSSELLASRQKDKDPLTARILSAINEEAVRLSKTVGDFLDYARPRNLHLEPMDLGTLLDQALTFLEQKCRDQGVEVVRSYGPGIVVQADKDLLYRAVYNILVNALEAMADQHKKESKGASGDEEDGVRGQIVVQAVQGKFGPRLTIMDTGPGIPADIRDKLLDPFFTTKESGTGLGLAITANILRSHGATLALSDNPEGGARVDIAFAKS